MKKTVASLVASFQGILSSSVLTSIGPRLTAIAIIPDAAVLGRRCPNSPAGLSKSLHAATAGRHARQSG